MKKVIVTYDTLDVWNKCEGETCLAIDVADNVAESWMRGSHAGFTNLEKLLTAAEYLKGREYIKKSVKHIELAR